MQVDVVGQCRVHIEFETGPIYLADVINDSTRAFGEYCLHVFVIIEERVGGYLHTAVECPAFITDLVGRHGFRTEIAGSIGRVISDAKTERQLARFPDPRLRGEAAESTRFITGRDTAINQAVVGRAPVRDNSIGHLVPVLFVLQWSVRSREARLHLVGDQRSAGVRQHFLGKLFLVVRITNSKAHIEAFGELVTQIQVGRISLILADDPIPVIGQGGAIGRRNRAWRPGAGSEVIVQVIVAEVREIGIVVVLRIVTVEVVVVVEHPLARLVAAVVPVTCAVRVFRLLAKEDRVDIFLVVRDAGVPAQRSFRLRRESEFLLEVVALLVLPVVEQNDRRGIVVLEVVVLVILEARQRRQGCPTHVVFDVEPNGKNICLVDGLHRVVVIDGATVRRKGDRFTTVHVRIMKIECGSAGIVYIGVKLGDLTRFRAHESAAGRSVNRAGLVAGLHFRKEIDRRGVCLITRRQTNCIFVMRDQVGTAREVLDIAILLGVITRDA